LGARTRHIQRIVLEAALAALAVVSSLVLAVIPNVELFTFVVFLSGVLLGPASGARVGLIAALAYGIVNPYGLPTIPLLAALVLARVLTGIVGGLMRPALLRARVLRRLVLFAAAGLLTTFVFDSLTNLSLVITIGQPRAVLVGALPFAVIHHLNNLVVFPILGASSLEVARSLPIPGLVTREER